LTDTVVLPTPPLPLVMAITRAVLLLAGLLDDFEAGVLMIDIHSGD